MVPWVRVAWAAKGEASSKGSGACTSVAAAATVFTGEEADIWAGAEAAPVTEEVRILATSAMAIKATMELWVASAEVASSKATFIKATAFWEAED